MKSGENDIITFLVVSTGIILLLTVLISTLLYLFQERRLIFQKKIATLELDHRRNLLESQIEIQENTFQHISREIHDNIGLSLTLAKLQLNTIDSQNKRASEQLISSSIDLISKSIDNLSDLSKTLNADIIMNQGLIDVLKKETERIQMTGLFTIDMQIKGNPVFMTAEKELITFRILQESLNNIIKHSHAKFVKLTLYYNHEDITIRIIDDGIGFQYPLTGPHTGSGLTNILTRTQALNGFADIHSQPGKGTRVHLLIPYDHE